MKELSIEEKAKAYDEALKAAVVAHKDEDRHLKACLECIFPELTEREDERIKKEIISHLKYLGKYCQESMPNVNKWIAWLEKQGEKGINGNEREIPFSEQKPAIEMKSAEESLGIDSKTYNKIVDECIYGEQKPAWSEEDEVALGDALWCCKQAASIAKDENDMGNVWCAEHWLKSLEDRYTWKPSDEQMKGIECTIKTLKYQLNCGDNRLDSLYNDLKKLKG